VTVRVNAPSTEWFERDIEESLSVELDAVVVPKLDRLEDLDRLASLLDAAGLHEIGVLVGIETALGVVDARQLLAHPRSIAAYFGAEDFIADMGGIRTESNEEVKFARAAVALAARLGGVPVLDQVVSDFRNDDRFLTEAAQARAMGFAGKMCIHPGQVGLANRAFSPTESEVDRARRLLAAYTSAKASGLGAVEFEGQMIDEPLAAQARRVVELASS
jgi:citrate lyase subunit beta/citryl-CoA lyase